MTRRRRKAAGPSAVAAPGEAPIAWPDHPLAASGGEILATRILPLMGHNARDFARAAAVCRGWRDACRAAAATMSVYRETVLQLAGDNSDKGDKFEWSPCGKFVAAAVYYPPRILIWRASTGALVNEWALATPATAVPQGILEKDIYVTVAFSPDSKRLLTLFSFSNHFAVWSVPDGQLLAVNRGDPADDIYALNADIGVPGSASDGLVGLGADIALAVDLWDVSPSPEGGVVRPRLRSRVVLAPGGDDVEDPDFVGSFAFSGDGSKFVASFRGTVQVYDVASLERLGAYTSPSDDAWAFWLPDSPLLWVRWDENEGGRSRDNACVWDFSRPEAPSVFTVDVGPDARFHSLSPSGASYFLVCKLRGRTRNAPTTHALEERRAAGGSLVRAVCLGSGGHDEVLPLVRMSHDRRALLVYPPGGGPARVIVFDWDSGRIGK